MTWHRPRHQPSRSHKERPILRREAGAWFTGLITASLATGACSRAVDTETPSPRPSVGARDAPVVTPKPRRGAERRAPRTSVRLAFTGDINLGTSTLPNGIPPDSGRTLFHQVRSGLTGDLVVGNFEGVFADTGTSNKCQPSEAPIAEPVSSPPPKQRPRPRPPLPIIEPPPVPCYAFLTPTHLAPRLAEAGFTHLNLANNHANDYGFPGRSSTEATVRRLGIELYGPLGNIAIDSVRRGDSLTVVALVGFTTYPHSYDLLDIAQSAAVVDSVRRLADLVIVTFHGGSEGMTATLVPEIAESLGPEPRGELRRWARAVIDAGADAVIGHGPHVFRGMEFYRGKLIAYSLGNFVTYSGFNLAGPLAITGVLQLQFAPNRTLTSARLVPMRQVPRRGVRPDPAGTAIGMVRRLSKDNFGPTGVNISDKGIITPP